MASESARVFIAALLVVVASGCASSADKPSTGNAGARASMSGSGVGAGGLSGAGGVASGSGGTAGTTGTAGTGAATGGAGAGGTSATVGNGGGAGTGNLGGAGASALGGTSGSGTAGDAASAGASATAGAGGNAAGGASMAGTAGSTGTGAPTILLVAGTGTGGDGSPAIAAEVLNPYGTAVDPVTGDIYIAEVDTGKIRHIDASGVITTVVGPGALGAAASIVLNQPHDLLFQPGTRILFIADTMNGQVYRLDTATGDAALFVGTGTPFAKLSIAYCLAFSPSGKELYYTGPDDIRVIDLDAVAAKPAVPYPAARVIAIDSQGTLYAVKNRPNGDALSVVDSAGTVTNMPATVNVVSDPKHLTIDADDNVLIADTELFYLRKYVVKSDTLVTLVGDGKNGTGTLGGDPLKAELKRPHGVFFDKKAGVTYISDSENNRVLKIVP